MKRLGFLLLLLPSVAQADFIRFYPPSGVTELTSNGSTITSTLPILLPDGTAAAPSLAFASQPGTGMYYLSNGIGYTTQGAIRLFISSGGVNFYNVPLALSDAGGANQAFLSRDAANAFAQKNGNNDQFFRHYGANGGYWERGVNSELLTIAASPTTDTTGNLLPANSIIEAVVVRVTVVIPTAATFTVGDATTAARFATGVVVAADTTAVGLLHRNPADADAAGPVQAAAAKVRITPDATPGAATGVVRIEVFYSRFVPPTS